MAPSITQDAKTRELRKARNLVRAIVVVGIAASVTANVLGAEDLTAAAVAGWPPVALLLSLEVLTRVPASKRLGAFGRVAATVAVAFASGWLSYWHMAATVSQHGERGGSQFVWPFSVDGLMMIAAIALVELGARLRTLEQAAVQTVKVEASAAPLIAAVEQAIGERPEWLPPVSPARQLRRESALKALGGKRDEV